MEKENPVAPLQPGLLARKGQARPGLRYPNLDDPLEPQRFLSAVAHSGERDPLAAPPYIILQQEELERRIKAAWPQISVHEEDAFGLLPIAGITLEGDAYIDIPIRLDEEGYLKLLIATNRLGLSANQILIEDLDNYLKDDSLRSDGFA